MVWQCTLLKPIFSLSNPNTFPVLQIVSLKELAEKLKQEDLSREKSGRIHSKLKGLLERRDRIKQLSIKRKEELAISRLICIFNRNAAEVDG